MNVLSYTYPMAVLLQVIVICIYTIALQETKHIFLTLQCSLLFTLKPYEFPVFHIVIVRSNGLVVMINILQETYMVYSSNCT